MSNKRFFAEIKPRDHGSRKRVVVMYDENYMPTDHSYLPLVDHIKDEVPQSLFVKALPTAFV